MTRTAIAAALAAAVLGGSVHAAEPAGSPGGGDPAVAKLTDQELAAKVDAIRGEMQSLNLVQAVLSWYTRTQGEPSIQAESYKGHEALYSGESVAVLGEAIRRAKAKGATKKTDDGARALDFLQTALALSVVDRETAAFGDERADVETTATVTLPWEKDPVPYRNLQGMISAEPDAARRGRIQSAVAAVYRDQLNPIIERKEAKTRQVVRDLGYESYIDLSQRYRWMDLGDLIAQFDGLYKSTDALYRQLLDTEVNKVLGIPVSKMRRADIGRLGRAPHLEKFLPKELMIPSFEYFLKGIGLDLTTAAGTQIQVDQALHPKKEPRAACFPIRVPGDIRVTVKPEGGVDDYKTFFHEGGHALHFGWDTSRRWEFQQLGPSWSTEGWAEFFSHAWDDPLWLARYRDFVKEWNRTQPGANVPVMTDADIATMVRYRVFWNLYYARRYGHAKLIYEAILHDGNPKLWKGIWNEPRNDLQEVYRKLFGEAYGFELTPEDALRFRTDVDEFFYAADYARAYIMADLMHEAMIQKFGASWYTNSEVGKLLKTTYWADGTKLQGDEILKLAGLPGFDTEMVRRRWERLLAWKPAAPPAS